MRPSTILGSVIVLLGVIALTVHSVTYFTSENQVGPLGLLMWNVSKPHTLVINPIAGLVAIALGLGVLFFGRRAATN